ncbi:hypothetical protein ACN083_03895 [Rothia sp. CCM 9418]|uniref:hypothetical protein n=1 Tax=Rothia sp. CCM 9418 TaxID=3402661 RepID=UPI003ADF7451
MPTKKRRQTGRFAVAPAVDVNVAGRNQDSAKQLLHKEKPDEAAASKGRHHLLKFYDFDTGESVVGS